ncbi:rab11 family-interacting protein 2 [Copidosoma floridanum]|uniref:rab11 family-interacting protein 2 n=1 Tax=Copidosoma floridanum TaxID=29053 RepID=UPI0006C9DD9D|nr:rab11 family-interacting protein 2 [Copidosoma floridanum]
MWSPTHVQVVVQRAKGLITKGKKNTNDCFVTIALGKAKYQTSVKEKAEENVEWHEECELPIPEQGNTAEIVLTALHRNFLGVDEFLGTVRIPLSSFDIYEMPKNRWYELTSKPGKENTKERGQLEVRIGFVVRAGSLTDLTKKEKHKSSLGQLSTAAQSMLGGSLLSVGSGEKRKGLKKLAKSIGSRVRGKSRSKGKLDDIYDEEEFRVGDIRPRTAGQEHGDADPGVISDEDEFTFDDLSHKSSTSSLNSSRSAATANSNWKTSDNQTNNSNPRENTTTANSGTTTTQNTGSTPPSKPPRFGLSVSSLNLSSKQESKQQVIPQKAVEDEWGQKLSGGMLKRWDNKRGSPKIVVEEPPREETTTTAAPVEVGSERGGSPVSRLKGEISESPGPGRKGHLFRKDKDKDKYKVVEHKAKQKSSAERIIIGGEESARVVDGGGGRSGGGRLPREIAEQFQGKSREDLIELVMQLQLDVADKKKRLHDMEEYIDSLLLRVIESSPKLLQNPYQPSRRLSSPGRQ